MNIDGSSGKMDDIFVHGMMIGLCLFFLLGLSTMQIGVIWNRMQDFLRRIFSGQ